MLEFMVESSTTPQRWYQSLLQYLLGRMPIKFSQSNHRLFVSMYQAK